MPAGTKHYGHTSRLTAGSNPHFPGMRFLVYAGRRRAGAVSRGAVGVRVRGKGPGGCGPQRQRHQTPIPVQRVTLGTPSYPITLGHSGCASGPAHHRDWAKRVGALAGQQACRWHLHVRIVFIILGETSARQQCVMQPRALQPSKLEL